MTINKLAWCDPNIDHTIYNIPTNIIQGKKMSSGTNDYQSRLFIDELKKCQIFYLKRPRGGQYNDGYELLGSIKVNSKKEFFVLLETLGVNYTTHTQKPDIWCPPPIEEEGHKLWMEYQKSFKCFGFDTHITIGTTDYSILFNFNSTSWYDVTLSDIKNAIDFEKELLSKGLIT